MSEHERGKTAVESPHRDACPLPRYKARLLRLPQLEVVATSRQTTGSLTQHQTLASAVSLWPFSTLASWDTPRTGPNAAARLRTRPQRLRLLSSRSQVSFHGVRLRFLQAGDAHSVWRWWLTQSQAESYLRTPPQLITDSCTSGHRSSGHKTSILEK